MVFVIVISGLVAIFTRRQLKKNSICISGSSNLVSPGVAKVNDFNCGPLKEFDLGGIFF